MPSSRALSPTTVFAKTAQARKALRDGGFPGPRAHRLFLIIVDGRKTLRELAAPLRSLGLDEHGLRQMMADGWLGVNVAPAADPSARAAPAHDAAPPPSLGAVKMYALDLLALMLPGRDAGLRAATREVHDEPALRQWIERAAAAIGRHAGDDRAAVFRERVGRQLPETV
jgi:hypothetical protein